MDYKDWLQKYYPIPASEVQGTDLDRIDHCINKWEGLKDAEPYGFRFYQGGLVDEDNDVVLYVNGESCALCEEYFDRDWIDAAEIYDCIKKYDGYPDHPCTKCPLARSLGRPCDWDHVGKRSVFFQAISNPQIMIDALKSARDMVEKASQ